MRKKLTVLGWLVALGVAGIISASERPAQAQVYVRIAPPALRIETRSRPPSRAHIWVGGRHYWTGRAYTWAPGRWTVRPRGRTVWVPGTWRHSHRGWYWRGGYWR